MAVGVGRSLARVNSMLHPGPLRCADSTDCEYSQVAGVAEVTIKHSYKDLYPKRFELIPAWYADRSGVA